MSTRSLRRRFSVVLVVVTVVFTLRRVRAGKPRDKLSWATVFAMGFLLRHIFSRNQSKFITNPSRVGRRVQDNEAATDFDEFDVIIVGGGTAGCVLASRLTEDPSLRVLVLESGGSGKSLILSRIPAAYTLLFHTKHVYELHTEPQKFAQEKTKYWPRGKMLGGCSSINGQMAHYGATGDFDEWATIIGDDSWSWKHFSRYFTKFENYARHAEYPLVEHSSKGTQGPMRIGYFSAITQASKDFVKACTTLNIPFNPDFNTIAGTRGANRIMTYMDESRQRVSSESAYLTDDVLARPNLIVALHAQVTRVVFDHVGDSTRAVGVEFAKSKNGPRFRARARREVILSAGAVHSPQILLLSGVGPARALEEHNIPIVLDLPGVGSHLVDHPVVDLNFKDKLNDSPKFVKPSNLLDVFKLVGSAVKYFAVRRGALTTNIGESAAFFRSDDPVLFPPSDYPTKFLDSTSAPNSPDLEILTTPFGYRSHGQHMFPVHTFGMHAILLRPISTGSLSLRSASPWDNPVMDPRYLEAPEDTEKLVRGLRVALKISRAEPLASRLDQDDKNPELDNILHQKSDKELRDIVRGRVETLYHPSGTCRMAPLEDGGVVDSRLRVYGIQGLRVCDASIFPNIVSGHTAGAVLAGAEKLSDIIKEEYSSA